MRFRTLIRALASLELAVAGLLALMLLVALCTVAQTWLGLLGAVDRYIRSPFVMLDVPGTRFHVPVFPGGSVVGVVLLANLLAAQWTRLELSWRKAGLWLAHLGVALLFAGQFVSGMLQREMRVALPEGRSVDYVENPREIELAVADPSAPGRPVLFSGGELARGGALEASRLPFRLVVRRYWANARLEPLTGPPEPGSTATRGLGARIAAVEPAGILPDQDAPEPAALVEAVGEGVSYGSWLLSPSLDEQTIEAGGRRLAVALRRRRTPLPFTLTLRKFQRELHPGTDIPRRFSSLVRLSNPATREERDALISMNRPLRYGGLAFYQSSFDRDDTVSILQVVRNPGWIVPYLASALVGAGMLLHLALRFAPGRGAA